MTYKQLQHHLTTLANPSYQLFSSSLLPTVDHILGIPIPTLRALAKTIAKEQWQSYLLQAQEDTFEEVMLQGLVIGSVKEDLPTLLPYIAAFVPKIHNWSVCDSFCSSLKITKTNRPLMWQFLQPYWQSPHPYAVRFALVMMLNYYTDDEYLEQVLTILPQINHDHYYVQMALAWTISHCFARNQEKTAIFLQNATLSPVVYQKALQKILDSKKVDITTKNWVRTLKKNSPKNHR